MARRVSLLILTLMAGSIGLGPGASGSPRQPRISNSFSVCHCGAVFIADDSTEYIEIDGDDYACCSHACYEAMATDTLAAATAARRAVAVMKERARARVTLANVLAVTSNGTQAVCCGSVFTVGPETLYIEHEGLSYACCSPQCHAYALKNPAQAAESFTAQVEALQ